MAASVVLLVLGGWLLRRQGQAFSAADLMLGLHPAIALAQLCGLLALLRQPEAGRHRLAGRSAAAAIATCAAALAAAQAGWGPESSPLGWGATPAGVSALLGPGALVAYLLSMAVAIAGETVVAAPAIVLGLQAVGVIATGVCGIGWLLIGVGALEFGPQVLARLAPGWAMLSLVAVAWNLRFFDGTACRAFVEDRPDRVALLHNLTALAVAILVAGLIGTGMFAFHLAETIRPLLLRGAGAHAVALQRTLDHLARESANAVRHAPLQGDAAAVEAAVRDALAAHGPTRVRLQPGAAATQDGLLPVQQRSGARGWLASIEGTAVDMVVPLAGRSETVSIAFLGDAPSSPLEAPILGMQAETLVCAPDIQPDTARCLTSTGLVTMRLAPRPDGRPWPMIAAWAGSSGVMMTLDRFGEGVAVGYAPVAGWALGVAHKVGVAALLRALAAQVMLAVSMLALFASVAAVLLYRRSHAVVSEMRFAKAYVNATFDAMPQAVLTLDGAGQVRRANSAAGALLGAEPDALLGRSLDRLLTAPASPAADPGPTQATALRDDGARREVEITRRPLPFEGRPGSVVMLLDVDEQRRIGESLRESEAGLAQAEQLAHLGHWRWTPGAATIRCSRQALRILGLPQGDAAALPVDTVVGCTHVDDRAAVRAAIAGVLADGAAAEIDHRIVRRDGSERLVHQMVCLLKDASGGVLQVMGTLLDITDSKTIEHELRASRQALRELLSNDEGRIEEERKRIAREIHDELGQLLTALRMDVGLLRLRSGGQAETVDLATRMLAKIDETIAVTRHVATHLRPASLDLGLVAALEWLAEDMAYRYEIQCRVEHDGAELQVREDVSTAAFRMVQECLTNVARHAQAQQVRIRLDAANGVLHLSVSDDGRGFDPNAPRPHGSFGLLGMRERAQMAGGRLEIRSERGCGTQVAIELPLDWT